MGRRFFVTLLCAALFASNAQAGTITISPVNIDLKFGQNSAMLQVKNTDSKPATVQLRVYRWAQTGNEDTLTPAPEFILSPPIATIPVGSTQTFRVLLRSGSKLSGSAETFRILVDEIPSVEAPSSRLGFVMRVSIPVFVSPKLPPKPALRWQATREGNGSIVLTVLNSASMYDKVSDLKVTTDDGTVLNTSARGSNNYILPSSQRQWSVESNKAISRLHLSIGTRTGRTDQLIAVGP